MPATHLICLRLAEEAQADLHRTVDQDWNELTTAWPAASFACSPAPGGASASFLSLQACALPKMHRCSDAASALSSAIRRRSGHHQAKSTTPYPPSLPLCVALQPEIANLQCTWLYRCAAYLPAQCLPCPACGGPGGLESIWCSHSCNLQDGQHAHGPGVNQASLHDQFLHWQASLFKLTCVGSRTGKLSPLSQQEALCVPAVCLLHVDSYLHLSFSVRLS